VPREAIYQLCINCLKSTHEIENALKTLDNQGPNRRWKSFRQALKAVLGTEKLESMKTRMDLYSQQLNNRMQIKTQHIVTDMKVDVMGTLEKCSEDSTKGHETTEEELKLLRLEAEQREARLRDELDILKQGLENCIREVVRTSSQASRAEQMRLADATNALYKA
jgi:hypothetical protein